MVKIINLEALKTISEESSIENINKAFQNIIVNLSESLLLDVINSQVKILFNINENFDDQQEQNVLDIGVKRSFEKDILIIEIFNQYKKFLPIILLREAYYSFVPNNLKENDTLKIVINQIIEIDLQKAGKIIKEWKSLVREQIMNYDFLSAQFDRLDKFLKLQGPEISERPMAIFFEYIRKNVQIIDGNKDEFYDDIFKEFVFKSSKSLKNDEIIETIRVLIKIFYKVKSYRALLDYQVYFKEFKKSGEIQTDLSLRKFTSNMKWINKYSYISPSYQVNWKALNVAVLPCQIRFHPLITKEQVDKVIEKLPFFVFSKSSESNFSIEVAGWFVAPKVYLKDILQIIKKLEQNGYILQKLLLTYEVAENFLNLNYFREFYKNKRIINPRHEKYDSGYEIHFILDCGEKYIDEKFSILDFLLLERIRYWSITGFSFERRSETLKQLKTDLINEIISQRTEIETLKDNLRIIHREEDLRNDFLQFFEYNKKFGFFYIKELLDGIILILNRVRIVLVDNSHLKTIVQLNEYIEKNGISNSLTENIIFRDKKVYKIILKDLIPIFFKNKKEFEDVIEKYTLFSNFFNSCSNLKIFELKTIIRIIQDEELVEKIYNEKEKKRKKSYESYKTEVITSNNVDELLDGYIDRKPPLIKPLLITTFSTNNFASYYLYLIVKNSNESKKNLDNIKKYFPRVTLNYGDSFFKKSNNNFIQIEMYLPNIVGREKAFLIAILFNLFKADLISIRRYYWDGFLPAYSRRNFYDFDKQAFFYTKDLFIQYFQYCEQVFGTKLQNFQESTENISEMLLSKENDMNKFVKHVADRISREKIEFNISKLKELSYFHDNLEEILKNPKEFKKYKQMTFFNQYIRSVKFKPALKQFGFDTFYLYIRPIDIKETETDIKLLLSNSFQKIKYPAFVDNAPSFLIKFLFPEDRPNKTHLNYIVKSRKIISEYCLFKISKIHHIIHFEKKLNQNGWSLSEKAFNAYAQRILFNPNYNLQISRMKIFSFNDARRSDIYGPDSKEFKDLSEIYNYKSLDLKSILGSNRKSQINLIFSFLEKKIIFPILKLKNLGLQEKLYIILPDIKKESVETIIKIFHYFPVISCFEIEGEWFIHGFENEKEKKFENGLFIKLYLPDINISGFQKAFDSIFDYFQIKKRLILTDMIDGSEMIKSIFGNLDFLKAYNPLKNFIWSDIDEKWMNIKLYGENFVKKYPDLI